MVHWHKGYGPHFGCADCYPHGQPSAADYTDVLAGCADASEFAGIPARYVRRTLVGRVVRWAQMGGRVGNVYDVLVRERGDPVEPLAYACDRDVRRICEQSALAGTQPRTAESRAPTGTRD